MNLIYLVLFSFLSSGVPIIFLKIICPGSNDIMSLRGYSLSGIFVSSICQFIPRICNILFAITLKSFMGGGAGQAFDLTYSCNNIHCSPVLIEATNSWVINLLELAGKHKPLHSRASISFSLVLISVSA